MYWELSAVPYACWAAALPLSHSSIPRHDKISKFHESQIHCFFFSSPEEISVCAQVTRQKAEEIYRYIRCTFDMQMLPNDLTQDRLKPDACSALQV